MSAYAEYLRRLALVRRIAELNTGQTAFSSEEETQFFATARLFTHAELEQMLIASTAAAKRSGRSRDSSS